MRISLSEDYEVRDWAKFGVTKEELTVVVKLVGNEAGAVEGHFKSAKSK